MASASCLRRLRADLKKLEEEPIPLASARPRSGEDDLSLWDGTICVKLDVTHIGTVAVPLHFLIDFPNDYPASAPNIGFSFDFPYTNGASFTESSGRLKGKKVICLDILGNFGHYHTEWKTSEGTGWTPAYSVTTLLVQLQSVLIDINCSMSQHARDVCYQKAVMFTEKNPSHVLECLDEDAIREIGAKRRVSSKLLAVFDRDETKVALVEDFAKKAGFFSNVELMSKFIDIVKDVCSEGAANGAALAGQAPLEKEVNTNICCYSTGKLYTETLLGVGVSQVQKNITSPAELLSLEAFQGGLRQTTTKAVFTDFLPVWINEAHASQNSMWVEQVKRSVGDMGSKFFQTRTLDDAVLQVLPRLVNQSIVEIMSPNTQKSAAIAMFEALCNYWRILRWFVESSPSLSRKVRKQLVDFVSLESARHKDVTPDLGMLLVMFAVYQGCEGCPARDAFISAYADENSLRQVMWWQRKGIKAESCAVFRETEVSRKHCMFNLMVVDIVIGDPTVTLKLMEDTNCCMPSRLELLQKTWRETGNAITSWTSYFKHLKVPSPASSGEDMQTWILSTVARAAERGPKYGNNAGGKGKGAGKNSYGGGKGGGKGGGRNHYNNGGYNNW